MTYRTVRPQGARLVGPLFAMFALMITGVGHADAAGICRVDVSGTGDGSSWASPMDLQSALDAASCVEVWVRQGVYTGPLYESIAITHDVRLYGGFAGSETTRAARNPAANVTTLSGAQNTTAITIVATLGLKITNNTVIDGFVITDGYDYVQYGGGMICAADGAGSECSPVINNVAFIKNEATNAGGALYIHATTDGIASPVISNATFSENHGPVFGGAVFIQSSATSHPVFYNVTFTDNKTDYSYHMGVIYAQGTGIQASVFNATFYGNPSDPAMGASGFASGDSVLLDNVISWANGASAGQPTNSNSQVTIRHSVVQNAFPGGTWDSSLGIDGGGNTQADPVLGALGNHGGATETFLLGDGSSAADAGSDACKTFIPLALDQRGMPRPQGVFCDIGAVEMPYATTLTIGSIGGPGSVSAATHPFRRSGDISACDGTDPTHCSADYAQGVTVQLTATPGPNASFTGWGGDCSGTGIHFTILMDAPKNCSASFAPAPDAALSVSIDDAREYARAGQVLTYGIAIDNSGDSDANSVAVDDTLPPQLDAASAQWQCLPTHGASCSVAGTGSISDTVDLPAHSSVFYILSVPVKSTADDTVVNQVGVTHTSGTFSASDSTTLVLFRDGFESGGDGAQRPAGLPVVMSLAGLSANSEIAVPINAPMPSRTMATLAASEDGKLRVQAIRVGETMALRLFSKHVDMEQASEWSVMNGQTAILRLIRDLHGRTHASLRGTQTNLDLLMR